MQGPTTGPFSEVVRGSSMGPLLGRHLGGVAYVSSTGPFQNLEIGEYFKICKVYGHYPHNFPIPQHLTCSFP